MTEEKENRLTPRIKALFIILFIVYCLGNISEMIYHDKNNIKTGHCPICSQKFEYRDTQSKVVCENCNYIMIFSVGDDDE